MNPFVKNTGTVSPKAGSTPTAPPPSAALPDSSLLLLQSAPGSVPTFHVPGGFGTPAFLPEMARVLGTDQTHYAFFCPGIDGSKPPLEGIDPLADLFTNALLEACPEGPFILVGYCFGGYVAYEMARRLRERGREPRLFALLECITFAGRTSPQFSEEHRRAALFLILQELYGDQLSSIAADDGESTGAILVKASEELQRRGVKQTDLRLEGMLRVFEANVNATIRYRPRPYAGNFTLFRTLSKFPEVGWLDPAMVEDMRLGEPDFGWKDHCTGKIDVVRIPGNHLTMLQPPNFPVTTSLLRQKLRAAMAAG